MAGDGLPHQVLVRVRSEDPEGCMKFLAWLIAAALILGVAGIAAPSLVHAQPVPTAERPAGQACDGPHAIVTKTHPHDDIVESSGKGKTHQNKNNAAASIAGALFVVTRRGGI